MTSFGDKQEDTLRQMATEAAHAALRDAELEWRDIDTVIFANSFAGLLQGQESIRGEAVFAKPGVGGRAVINVENACAGGSTAIVVGTALLAAGQAEHVLVVGAEKLNVGDRSRTLDALATALDTSEPRPISPAHSVFMEHYAKKARAHMARSGITVEHYAAVASKNLRCAATNPYAHRREAHSIDDVLASRPIVSPLTLYMCSPISDGAAAVVLGRPEHRNGHHPKILAAAVAAGDGIQDPSRWATARAFAEAGVVMDDIDVAEVHDATAPAELIALEEIGLVSGADDVELDEAGKLELRCRARVNPSGGLIGRGHPVAATGVAQVVEIVWQLRGQAGTRQVPSASVGLCHNVGGVIKEDAAVACILVVGQ